MALAVLEVRDEVLEVRDEVLEVLDVLDNTCGSCGTGSGIHARSLDRTEDKEALYREWGNEQYEQDVFNLGYTGPATVAGTLAKYLDTMGSKTVQGASILDAGCGTGLVGTEFLKTWKGAPVKLVGCDICPEMMALAKERGYTECHKVDLNQPLEYADGTFQAIVSSGTFYQGHVYADPALSEFYRILASGGYAILTVRTSFFQESDEFSTAIAKIEEAGGNVMIMDFQYLKGVVAKLVVIHKPAAMALDSTSGSSGTGSDNTSESWPSSWSLIQYFFFGDARSICSHQRVVAKHVVIHKP